MKNYLTKTKYDTYKYQRRVPQQLTKHLSIDSFRISLGSDITEANLKAAEFNTLVNEAIKLLEENELSNKE